MFGAIQDKKFASKETQIVRRKKLLSTTVDKESVSNNGKYCEFCKKNNHYLSSCLFFQKQNLKEKSEFVKKSNLCFGCLRKGHISSKYTTRLTCSVCNRKHPTLIHDPEKEVKQELPNPTEPIPPAVTTCSACSAVGNAIEAGNTSSKIRIVPPILPAKIRVQGCSKFVTVNCALDSCSSDC